MFAVSLILCVLTIFTASPLTAQDGAAPQDHTRWLTAQQIDPALKQITDRFFELLAVGQVDAAFDELLKNSKMDKDSDQRELLVNRAKRTIELYGGVKDTEEINAEAVIRSYVRLRYVTLHTDFPMRWSFTFYNSPDKGWIATTVKLDDRIDDLFSGE